MYLVGNYLSSKLLPFRDLKKEKEEEEEAVEAVAACAVFYHLL